MRSLSVVEEAGSCKLEGKLSVVYSVGWGRKMMCRLQSGLLGFIGKLNTPTTG